jgi:hypothetical protein
MVDVKQFSKVMDTWVYRKNSLIYLNIYELYKNKKLMGLFVSRDL